MIDNGHQGDAADAFANRARAAHGESIRHLVVFSIHVLSAQRFEANNEHPFIRTAFEEGHTYV